MTLAFNQYLPGVISYTPTLKPPTVWRINASFTGEGGLTGAITSIHAQFSGSGTLSAIITSMHPQFAGEGTLSAPTWIGRIGVNPTFSAYGQLTATVTPQ